MPPKREDYSEYVSRMRAAMTDDRLLTAGTIRTAAVHAEKLVGQPEWDAYQQQLQAMIEDAEKQVLMYTQQLTVPTGPWDGTTMAMLKGLLALWQGRRDALKEALMLPHSTIQAYREGQRDA